MSSGESDIVARRAAEAGADLYVKKNQELVTCVRQGIEELLQKSEEPKEEHPISRVLVVDDSAVIRRLMKNALTKLDVPTIVEACDGREGFEKLAGEEFDLVLSDLTMPRMGGLALIEAIRGDKRYARLPVVLVTGEEDETIIEQCRAAGASDFLCKPFNGRSIKALLERFS